MKTDPLKEIRIRKRLEQAQSEQLAGRLAEARGIYEELLTQNAAYLPAIHGLGVLCVQEGNLEEAECWLRQATEADPEEAGCWNDFGEALRHLGRTDEALTAYRRAISLHPGFAEAMNNLGVVLAGLAQTEEAKQWFNQAIQANPHYAHPYNNLGVVNENEGSLAEALRCYEEAVKRQPDFGEAKENYTALLAQQPDMLMDSMQRLLGGLQQEGAE